MSIFVSFLLMKFQAKNVMAIALLINSIFCGIFAISPCISLIYIARFFMGTTQAFWVIYAPVWANVFSPVNKTATWVGILQGFSPLG